MVGGDRATRRLRLWFVVEQRQLWQNEYHCEPLTSCDPPYHLVRMTMKYDSKDLATPQTCPQESGWENDSQGVMSCAPWRLPLPHRKEQKIASSQDIVKCIERWYFRLSCVEISEKLAVYCV